MKKKEHLSGRVELKKPITHVDVLWYAGSYHFSFNDEESGVMILSGYADERAFNTPSPPTEIRGM